jgi:hypothetical protein
MRYDKAITRACADRAVDYLIFGRRWRLDAGGVYAVRFDRKRPGRSKVVKVGERRR